jgi:hypothetical protein
MAAKLKIEKGGMKFLTAATWQGVGELKINDEKKFLIS